MYHNNINLHGKRGIHDFPHCLSHTFAVFVCYYNIITNTVYARVHNIMPPTYNNNNNNNNMK